LLKLPECFPSRLRSVLEARPEDLKEFIKRIVAATGGRWDASHLDRVLRGAVRPSSDLVAALQADFLPGSWLCIVGAAPSFDLDAESAAFRERQAQAAGAAA